MLLRNTASALALAATLSLSTTRAPGAAMDWARHPAPTTVTEVGSGPGSALFCIGCVTAGVLSLVTGSATGTLVTLLIGGVEAVAAGGYITSCVIACTAYLSAD